MKCAALRHAVLALPAAVALTACGGSAPAAESAAALPSTAAPATAPPSTAAPAAAPAPLTCRQQFDAWKKAIVPAQTRFNTAIDAFSATSAITSAQAHALESASQAEEDSPLPVCADPKGYWQQSMAQFVAVGTVASPGGAVAEGATLPLIHKAETDLNLLSAELLKTIGESPF